MKRQVIKRAVTVQLGLLGGVPDPHVQPESAKIKAQRLERLQVQVAKVSIGVGNLVRIPLLLVVIEEVIGVGIHLGANFQLKVGAGPFGLPDDLDIAAVDAAEADIGVAEVDRKPYRPGSGGLLVGESGLEYPGSRRDRKSVV